MGRKSRGSRRNPVRPERPTGITVRPGARRVPLPRTVSAGQGDSAQDVPHTERVSVNNTLKQLRAVSQRIEGGREAQDHLIVAARREGASWDQLSVVTGINRETLRRRFTAPDTPEG